jgi:hypothetical protein
LDLIELSEGLNRNVILLYQHRDPKSGAGDIVLSANHIRITELSANMNQRIQLAGGLSEDRYNGYAVWVCKPESDKIAPTRDAHIVTINENGELSVTDQTFGQWQDQRFATNQPDQHNTESPNI